MKILINILNFILEYILHPIDMFIGDVIENYYSKKWKKEKENEDIK